MNYWTEEPNAGKQIRFEKIHVCSNPVSRARGVFFRKPFTDRHAVLLEQCSSVHGIGLSMALDVIFLNDAYRVLSVARLNPFGILFLKGASHVLEVRAGVAERNGIKPGDCLELPSESAFDGELSRKERTIDRGRQAGASMVEFLLVAPLLMYFGVGIIQFGMVYHSRNVLDYATFEAARVGAVNQADMGKMKGELAYRLGPMFPGNGGNEGVRSAVFAAIRAVNDPLRTQVRIINPTPAVFDDFGINDPDTGEIVLPNAHLQHRSEEIGDRSGLSIQDANLLKIEVTHGYELRLPWLDIRLPGVDFILRELMVLANPSDAAFYSRGQFPLRAVATVRMQSNATENNVKMASKAVSRPDTQTLPATSFSPQASTEGDSAVTVDQENGPAGTTGASEASTTQGNPVAGCVGPHGLPQDLAITTLHSETDAGLCSYLPRDAVLAEPQYTEDSGAAETRSC